MICPASSHPLWPALRDFSWKDDINRLTFVDRLARDHQWTHEYARRVLREYLRFLFLASAADHKVTPSVDIDEVWHLHMVYTESYWNDLCRDILKRPLHHGPTRGGAAEDTKFEKWYERTLHSYTHWFCEPPPADIWPDPVRRFSQKDQYRTIRQGDYLLIPLKWSLLPRAAAYALIPVTAMGIMAFDDSASTILIVGFLVFIALTVVLPALFKRRKHPRDRRKKDNDSGCTPYMGTGCSVSSPDSHPHSSSGDSGADHSGSGCSSSGCSSSGCGGGGCGGGGGD